MGRFYDPNECPRPRIGIIRFWNLLPVSAYFNLIAHSTFKTPLPCHTQNPSTLSCVIQQRPSDSLTAKLFITGPTAKESNVNRFAR